jgi:hypothetical protein
LLFTDEIAAKGDRPLLRHDWRRRVLLRVARCGILKLCDAPGCQAWYYEFRLVLKDAAHVESWLSRFHGKGNKNAFTTRNVRDCRLVFSVSNLRALKKSQRRQERDLSTALAVFSFP